MHRQKRAISTATTVILLLNALQGAGPTPAQAMRVDVWPATFPDALVAVDNVTALASDDPITRLERAAGSRVSVSGATGKASFVRVASAAPLSRGSAGAGAQQQAAGFFAQHGDAFGVTNAASQLVVVKDERDAIGATHVTYVQQHEGVPVWGGIVKVHVNPAGGLDSVNGAFVPDIKVSTKPRLTAEGARNAAFGAVRAKFIAEGGFASLALSARKSTLMVYRTGLAKAVPGQDHLVWQIEVIDGAVARDFVYVDALNGKIVEHVQSLHSGLKRNVYEGGYSPARLLWTEGNVIPYAGPTVTLTESTNDVLSGTAEIYNLFRNAFGRLAYDGKDSTMEIVTNDPRINCPNANWNGVSTNYCTGVTADDTVAHEWGHAFTEYTHDLVYAWQPGALNEAYSDIWGEVVDLLNNRQSDAPNTPRPADICTPYGPPISTLIVNTPTVLAGVYEVGTPAFGPTPTITGTTGVIVLATDGVGRSGPNTSGGFTTTRDACTPLTNGAAISGNIALVERGSCDFSLKVWHAQIAGAIGVVVMNHVAGGDGIRNMGAGENAISVTIPSVFVGNADGVGFMNAPTSTVDVTIRSAGSVTQELSYRWVSSEDDLAFGGAIRDMWAPNCMLHPARVTDNYYTCSATDSGGVHSNSGVPNHGFALLVDGGIYNGQTITGLGLTKAAHIYWRAQSVYQISTSGFPEHADALEQSCVDLTGINLPGLSTGNPVGLSGMMITGTDCAQVGKMIAAVEFRAPPTQCNFEPLLTNPPDALCVAGTATTVFTDTLVTMPTHWTNETTGVYSEALPITWVWTNTLPGGRIGSAFYASNVFDKDTACSEDIEDGSRVMSLHSPVFTFTAGLPYTMPLYAAFDHYIATELNYDGGTLWVSVNGGGYQSVDGADFTFNPYNDYFDSGTTHPYANYETFTGADGGSVFGSWGRSIVNLDRFVKPGDKVQLRWDFATDGCGGVDGWYVDDPQAYYCANGESMTNTVKSNYLPVVQKAAPLATPTRTPTATPNPVDPTRTPTATRTPTSTPTAFPTLAPTVTATPFVDGCSVMAATLSGENEVSPNNSAATGVGEFRVETAANTMAYTITLSGLISETAAHIHGFAPPGTNAGVVHPLSVGNVKTGTWTFTNTQQSMILEGLAYVNVHTSNFGGGEIRGQIERIGACAP